MPSINLHHWNYNADQLLDKIKAALQDQDQFVGSAVQRTVVLEVEGKKDHVITRVDILGKKDRLPTSRTVDYGTIVLIEETFSIDEAQRRLAGLAKLQIKAGSTIFQFAQGFGFSDQTLSSNNDYGILPGTLFDVNMPAVQLPQGPLLHHELPSYKSVFAAIKDFLQLRRFNDYSDSRLGHLLVYLPIFYARISRLELQEQELQINMESAIPPENFTLEVLYENDSLQKSQKLTPSRLNEFFKLEFIPTKLQIWLFSKAGGLIDFHDETNAYCIGANPVLPKTQASPLLPEDEDIFITDEPEAVEPPNYTHTERTVTRSIDQSPAGHINVAIKALADSPSEVDLLDFRDYARALADFIESDKTQTPLTIGVDGAWGSGKTTLMKLLRTILSRNRESDSKLPKHLTVWFNAWKYDREESLWAALALEILAQARQQLSIWKRIELWIRLNINRFDKEGFFQALFKSAIYPAILVTLSLLSLNVWGRWIKSNIDMTMWSKIVGGTGAISWIALFFTHLRTSIKGPFELGIFKYVRQLDYKQRLGFLGEFERDFKFVIDAVTDKGKSHLVIFVDDLDRCKPAKPVEVIEAIHQLLDAEPCIFVIGMDIHTVAASVQTKYKDMQSVSAIGGMADGLNIGYRFLEKIIQIPFHIPSPSADSLERMIRASLIPQKSVSASDSPAVKTAEDLISSEEKKGKSLEEASQIVEHVRPELGAEVIIQAKQNIFARSFDDDPSVRSAIDSSVLYLEYNPRKLKRFINVFRLQILIANRRGLLERGDIQINKLAAWLLLVLRFPDFASFVRDDDFIDRLWDARKLRHSLGQSMNTESAGRVQTRLQSLLTDQRINRFINSSELFDLLLKLIPDESIKHRRSESLIPYLELSSTLTPPDVGS